MTIHNTLPSNAKAASIEVLSALLVDGVDLALVTKQAHWNLRGPRFIALHEMIDGFRAEIDVHVDIMAERIVQLGAAAVATSQAVAESSRLTPYPTNITAENLHLAALLERFGAVATSVRAGVSLCADAGDANSADILTAYSRALDKTVWLLEAHRA